MTSLDDFLNAKDLDDLLKVRREMPALTTDELKRVNDVLRDWQDGQAISNLLFYPSLIPEPIRWDVIDRALCCDRPYFVLAAAVGLQSVDPDAVPADIRKRWVTRLLEIIRSDGEVLSSRASVTIWPWLRDGEIHEFVRAFPVPDETATKNIIAFTLSRFGQCTRAEYCERLKSCGLGFWRRRRFVRKFDDYRRKNGTGGAVFMKMPLLSYIPNYGSVES